MSNFAAVFTELRSLIAPYADGLDTKVDSSTNFSLDTKYVQKNKKPLFFGAVEVKKNYVSYHLMPVYVDPSLLNDISQNLKKHMQGKSCFNFTEIDKSLFKELATLTKSGYAKYRENGYV